MLVGYIAPVATIVDFEEELNRLLAGYGITSDDASQARLIVWAQPKGDESTVDDIGEMLARDEDGRSAIVFYMWDLTWQEEKTQRHLLRRIQEKYPDLPVFDHIDRVAEWVAGQEDRELLEYSASEP